MTTIDQKKISEIARILHGCKSVFFITCAGMSADSGLPTYRGIGGLYDSGFTDEGVTIEDALSGEMMEARPDIAWKYIARIEESCRGARFNRGHEVIAEMARAFDRVTVLTQNIDGFHRDAGSADIIDIHGDLHDLVCTACERKETVPDFGGLAIPPECPDCGALVRPEVVLFGEMLDPDKCDRIAAAWKEPYDIVFTVGTTSVFPYIAQPVMYAGYHGIPTVEINPGDTQVSAQVDFRIRAGAAETLDMLWNEYRSGQPA